MGARKCFTKLDLKTLQLYFTLAPFKALFPDAVSTPGTFSLVFQAHLEVTGPRDPPPHKAEPRHHLCVTYCTDTRFFCVAC